MHEHSRRDLAGIDAAYIMKPDTINRCSLFLNRNVVFECDEKSNELVSSNRPPTWGLDDPTLVEGTETTPCEGCCGRAVHS